MFNVLKRKIKDTDFKLVGFAKWLMIMAIPTSVMVVTGVVIWTMFQVWGLYTFGWMALGLSAGYLGELINWDIPEDKTSDDETSKEKKL
jgi:hypothetical protein